MSVEAITCALRIKLPPGNSTAKHVLTILANHANGDPYVSDEVEAWPSIAALVDSTGQDRKTVIANLQKLTDWGLVSDTGRRVGRTGQIVVYALHVGPDLLREQSRNRNGSNIGTVTPRKESQYSAETVPIFRGNSTDIGTRNRQGTVREESITPAVAHDDRVGSFEGHGHGPFVAATATPTEAGAIAAHLRQLGFRFNSQSPDLRAALAEGVTLAHVAELAELYPFDHPKSRGSPGYLLAVARRQLAEAATPVPRGTHASTSTRSNESAVDRAARRARAIAERTGVGG